MIETQKIITKGTRQYREPSISRKSVVFTDAPVMFGCTEGFGARKGTCAASSTNEFAEFSKFGMLKIVKSAMTPEGIIVSSGGDRFVSGFKKGTECKVDDTYPPEKGGPLIVCANKAYFEKPWKRADTI